MKNTLLGRIGTVTVGSLLALQLVVLYVSLGTFGEISLFCVGPHNRALATLFFAVHSMFGVLFLTGLASLRFRALWMPYAALLIALLCTLPVQAHLVSTGSLQCDAP